MKLFKAGEKGKAVCESCKDIVKTTFYYRDIPFRDSPGIVKDILVSVCDTCDSIVAVPAQSAPAIKAFRDTATKSIEVNLPAPFVEVLDLAAFRIDPQATTEFRKRLLAYYIHQYATNEDAWKKISSLIEKVSTKFAARGAIPKKRLSFKVTPRLDGEINLIMHFSKLKKTEIIKGLVMQIDKDIVQPKKPRHLAELQRLAAVVAG